MLKRLEVLYAGWGERWHLGTLADDGTELLFEYSPEAMRQGLQLSPRHLELRSQAYGGFPAHLSRLPGLIADALPDGWGLLVMDRFFRKQGLDASRISALDRLAFIGERALGALVFEPASSPDLPSEALQLLDLATEVQEVAKGKDSAVLTELALLGGSPHGARPKVLVFYDAVTQQVSTDGKAGGQPWLVKFQAATEHKEVCALEDLYAQLARNCGIDMPSTRYFDLNRKLSAFGTRRFDVEANERVPVHSFAGALHADFRQPGTLDYLTLLRTARLFTGDEREVQKAFERAAFNVLFHNRDDHPKNFSFRMNRQRRWKLAPAYDLTYSSGPGGEHQMDVAGEGRAPGRTELLTLAAKGGVNTTWAANVLERFADEAGTFKALAADWPIRPATVKAIRADIEAARKRFK